MKEGGSTSVVAPHGIIIYVTQIYASLSGPVPVEFSAGEDTACINTNNLFRTWLLYVPDTGGQHLGGNHFQYILPVDAGTEFKTLKWKCFAGTKVWTLWTLFPQRRSIGMLCFHLSKIFVPFLCCFHACGPVGCTFFRTYNISASPFTFKSRTLKLTWLDFNRTYPSVIWSLLFAQPGKHIQHLPHFLPNQQPNTIHTHTVTLIPLSFYFPSNVAHPTRVLRVQSIVQKNCARNGPPGATQLNFTRPRYANFVKTWFDPGTRGKKLHTYQACVVSKNNLSTLLLIETQTNFINSLHCSTINY